jgi:N6-adenosine-specific RNA methylase IME4
MTAAEYTNEPARVLLADPAWLFGDKLPGQGRGASKHYGCLTVGELECFELPPLANDCLLMLWRVAAMQPEAFRVAKAWGFTIKAEGVWRKLTKNGKEHFGMGRYVRMSHETYLIGVRESNKPKIAHRAIRSTFEAPGVADVVDLDFEAPTGAHSVKPDRIYEIAEALIPGGPYVELFARRRRAGWIQYGDELEPESSTHAVGTTTRH